MVHQYKNNGYNIVLDANSGSVHVVDDVAYDIIALYEDHTPQEITAAILKKYADQPDVTETEIQETLSDIEQLKKDGRLFSEDTYENLAWDFKNRSTVIKALCLHIAHDCNLACKYCFAGKGEYCGDKALMSFEVGKPGAGFSNCKLRYPTQPGSRLLRRRASDEF